MPAGRAACRLSKCKIQVQGIDAAAKGSLPRGGNIMVVQGVRESEGFPGGLLPSPKPLSGKESAKLTIAHLLSKAVHIASPGATPSLLEDSSP